MNDRRRYVETPDLRLIDDVVAKRIIDAMHASSKALTKAGVRHMLIGGLAVGAYGYARATKDVDFVVGDEAFSRHGGGLVTFKPGIPIEVNHVAVDLLGADVVTAHELDDPEMTERVPIIDFESLIYMKLLSFRRRDQEDIVELFKAGHDEKTMRKFLADYAPELIAKFDKLAGFFDDGE